MKGFPKSNIFAPKKTIGSGPNKEPKKDSGCVVTEPKTASQNKSVVKMSQMPETVNMTQYDKTLMIGTTQNSILFGTSQASDQFDTTRRLDGISKNNVTAITMSNQFRNTRDDYSMSVTPMSVTPMNSTQMDEDSFSFDDFEYGDRLPIQNNQDGNKKKFNPVLSFDGMSDSDQIPIGTSGGNGGSPANKDNGSSIESIHEIEWYNERLNKLRELSEDLVHQQKYESNPALITFEGLLKSVFAFSDIDDHCYNWFFSLMIYLGKCYIRYTNSDLPVYERPTDTMGEETTDKLKQNIKVLIGPQPHFTDLDSSGMRSLDVIPVGITSSSTNKKLFVCILDDSKTVGKMFMNDSFYNIDVNGFMYKSYFVSYRREVVRDGRVFLITKYMDRISMRKSLEKRFANEDDKIEFALFVLENIDKLVISEEYVKDEKEYAILDLYSLVTDVFKRYAERQRNGLEENILMYDIISARKVNSLQINRTVYQLGIKTRYGVVKDSCTIAYAYWVYRMKYIDRDYFDRAWLRQEMSIRTNKDSNVDCLCNYVFFDGISDNMFTIDSYFSTEEDGFSGSDLEEMVYNFSYMFEKGYIDDDRKFDNDLRTYLKIKGSDSLRVITGSYLAWISGFVKGISYYDISMIYHLIYTMNLGCSEQYNYMKEFGKRYMELLESDKKSSPSKILFNALLESSPFVSEIDKIPVNIYPEEKTKTHITKTADTVLKIEAETKRPESKKKKTTKKARTADTQFKIEQPTVKALKSLAKNETTKKD